MKYWYQILKMYIYCTSLTQRKSEMTERSPKPDTTTIDNSWASNVNHTNILVVLFQR